MYHPNFRYFQFINSLPDEVIANYIVQAERYVRKRHPHAVLMFSTDRKGKTTHVGIYDVRLLLNERHNFKAGLQYAPQMLGERLPWSDDWESAYRLRYIDNLWATLAVSIMGKEVEAERRAGTVN